MARSFAKALFSQTIEVELGRGGKFQPSNKISTHDGWLISMLPYFILLAVFSIGAFVSGSRSMQAAGGLRIEKSPRAGDPIFVLAIVGMIAMIGLRYRVGADWDNYVYIFDQFRGKSFSSSLGVLEPGYGALNWFALQAGYDVWFVNLVCGALFGWGLLRLCQSQPRPWLSAAVAIPYMVIVLAMGYTRQAAALGILMVGLGRQCRGAPVLNFAIYAAAAALFHKTAVVIFPLVAVSGRGNRVANALILVSASYVLYSFFLSDAVDDYVSSYIGAGQSSQGAFIRCAMNALAAALFWLYQQRLGFTETERKIWRNFAIGSIGLFVALAFVPSSTAVDRISLYLLPLQIIVLARVAALSKNQAVGTSVVLVYATLIQFVWLNYAQFAMFWVPYQLFPFS